MYKIINEIKNDIKNISKFNLEYYKIFYINDFKNENQVVNVRINEKKFYKLYKNSIVFCEEKEFKKALLLKNKFTELIKIYNEDIVITTFISSLDGVEKIKKFNKLKIISRD